jgi:transcriptional regulator with XRE-family HTH domain
MARHTSATLHDARATFLLEVALDRARLKQRLAEALHRERVRRGGGDARRFPQPKMAELLGYSLRQYQRLENSEDPNLPSWNDLERIAEVLELDAGELFASEEPEGVSRDAEVRVLREELAESRGQYAALEREIQELRRLFEERLPAAPGGRRRGA